MADAEVLRHQRIWKDFTTFMKLGIAGVVTLLVLMAIFLL